MKDIEILLQGEGIPDIKIVTIGPGKLVRDLLALAASHRVGLFEGELFLFCEDGEEPLSPEDRFEKDPKGHPLRLHVHRCRKVEVQVTFNGVTKEHRFSPGKTIAVVKNWAAIKAFGLDRKDAAEHVLQLSGTTVRPEADTHIGSLVTCPKCDLHFDLVPRKRVEG